MPPHSWKSESLPAIPGSLALLQFAGAASCRIDQNVHGSVDLRPRLEALIFGIGLEHFGALRVGVDSFAEDGDGAKCV